jgi:hypothetical protein
MPSSPLHMLVLDCYDPVFIAALTIRAVSAPVAAALSLPPPEPSADRWAYFLIAPREEVQHPVICIPCMEAGKPSALKALAAIQFDWATARALVAPSHTCSLAGISPPPESLLPPPSVLSTKPHEPSEDVLTFYMDAVQTLANGSHDLDRSGTSAAVQHPDLHLRHHHVKEYLKFVKREHIEAAFEGMTELREVKLKEEAVREAERLNCMEPAHRKRAIARSQVALAKFKEV